MPCYYFVRDFDNYNCIGITIFEIFPKAYNAKKEKFTFYKYKVRKVYGYGLTDYHRVGENGFEQFWDHFNNKWCDNEWPAKLDFKNPELNPEGPISFLKKFNSDEEAILWFELAREEVLNDFK